MIDELLGSGTGTQNKSTVYRACWCCSRLQPLPDFGIRGKPFGGVIAIQVDMTDISNLHGMDYHAIQLVKYTSLEIDRPTGLCIQFPKVSREAQVDRTTLLKEFLVGIHEFIAAFLAKFSHCSARGSERDGIWRLLPGRLLAVGARAG
jgi:hypothetical protein